MKEVVTDWCPSFPHLLLCRAFLQHKCTPESCLYGRQRREGGPRSLMAMFFLSF